MADRLMTVKIRRKVELAKDEMIVRLVVLTKSRVSALMKIRLT